MDLMTLAAAFAVVATAGIAGLVLVLRSRFQLLAAHVDADRNRMPHPHPKRRKAAKQRPAKTGQMARLGYPQRRGDALAH